jgi:glycosyltransferase involved in cell wall biosynthesis
MTSDFTIIHNGADNTIFFPQKSPENPNQDIILLHEHFRRDDGGLKTVLDAFTLVHKKRPNSRLMLAGRLSGEIPQIVTDFIKQSDAPVQKAIDVLGPTNHVVLPDIIRKADVFVHPIANSACPHTVLEVLSSGVPVICYSGTGPAEFVGESGVVLQSEYDGVQRGFERFPRQDPSQLAEAIIRILKDNQKYKSNARSRAQKYSSQITGQKYLDVFEEAVNTPSKQGSIANTYWLVSKYNISRAVAKSVELFESKLTKKYDTRAGT